MSQPIQPQDSQQITIEISVEKVVEDEFQKQENKLEKQLQSLREMINLLEEYEKDCVHSIDLQNAKETRNRIHILSERQEELVKKLMEIKQDKEEFTIRQQSQNALQSFDCKWSEHLNRMMLDLSSSENKIKASQLQEKQQLIEKFEQQKNNFKGSTRLNGLKRKIIGLMKLRLYEQAQIQSKNARELELYELKQWEQKVKQKKQQALNLLTKKQTKQLQVLRSKNESALMRKMKERDNKFQLLLKKQQIKQLELKKTNKEMTKAYSTISLGAKRLR